MIVLQKIAEGEILTIVRAFNRGRNVFSETSFSE
jgi:hypothetical protein